MVYQTHSHAVAQVQRFVSPNFTTKQMSAAWAPIDDVWELEQNNATSFYKQWRIAEWSASESQDKSVKRSNLCLDHSKSICM